MRRALVVGAGFSLSLLGCSLLVSASDYFHSETEPPFTPPPSTSTADAAADGDAPSGSIPPRLVFMGGEELPTDLGKSKRPGLEVGVAPVDVEAHNLVFEQQPAAAFGGAHLLPREVGNVVVAVSRVGSSGFFAEVAPLVGAGLGDWTSHKLSSPPNADQATLVWAGDFLLALDAEEHFVASFDARTLAVGGWRRFDERLTLPLTDRRVAVVGEWLLFVGGKKPDGTPSAEIELFSIDLAQGRLRGPSTVTTMPTAIEHPCVAAVDGRLYVMGSEKILVADVATAGDEPLGQWRSTDPLSTFGPKSSACVAYQGRLYWTGQLATVFSVPFGDAGVPSPNEITANRSSDIGFVSRGQLLALPPR